MAAMVTPMPLLATASKSGAPGFGWMQSTGQTSMHESSLMQLPTMT